MGHKLPPNEAELYKRCGEVLHYVWDPIGVSAHASARDEYYAYIPLVLGLINENASSSRIASALTQFESEGMGVTPDKKKAREVAEILLEWRDWINESLARDLVDGRQWPEGDSQIYRK